MMKKLTLLLMIVSMAFMARSQTTCMDSTAMNYGAMGQCQYDTAAPVYCMDSTAMNFGAMGQCQYDTAAPVYCMDSTAMNYGAMGQCQYDTAAPVYCMDSTAMNYGAMGQCQYDTAAPVYCMDSTAMNYGAMGQCQYDTAAPVYCMDSTATNFGAMGQCQFDTTTVVIYTGDVYGCTDVNAQNYSSNATINNGSCTYPVDYTGDILGCMDVLALNYNSNASVSDASCIFEQIEVKTPITLKPGEIVTDELFSTVASACNVNYGRLIDSAVVKEASINGFIANVVWEVWQSGVMNIVEAEYDLSSITLDYNGNYILYVTISCASPASRPTVNAGVKLRGLLRPAVITGFTSATKEESLQIIPNPVQDELTVSSKYNVTSMEILDVNGLVVKTIENSDESTQVGDLAGGIYFLKIISESGELVIQKFVKK